MNTLQKNKISIYLLFVITLISSCRPQKENPVDFYASETVKMQLYGLVDTSFVDTLLSKTIKAHYELFKSKPKYFELYSAENGEIRGIRSSMTYCGDFDYEIETKFYGFCFYKKMMLLVQKNCPLKYFREEKDSVYVNFITVYTPTSWCIFDSLGNLVSIENEIIEVN